MNANAEIVVAEASNALVVPNAAVIRGGYVLVTKKSPSAANAVEDMDAPEGYVYVKVETGVSDEQIHPDQERSAGGRHGGLRYQLCVG